MRTAGTKFVDKSRLATTCFLLVLAFLSGSACRKGQITTTNQPTASPSAEVATSTPTPEMSPSVVRYFDGTGVVTKIVKANPYDGRASVELDHDEIVGLMPAMRMEFYVKNVSLLNGLKVGDSIEFTIEEKGGTEIISRIKKK